jgi:pyruvate/2-oxoacid:ferredoxin oxidoreductase beta subunit/pyruvate/2-oxoacid:ferredoxin oxidoreductase alpha subunit/Pyruvate/2-oxoacid:ferredoxin oxidoreductase delta subunit
MIPNMFKIAGEQTATVFHIAARAVATHALSIFGDHSDVMATRSCGWAMLFANSVQETMDFALVAQAATLKARVPFLHIFDGFRTSHEVMKIERLSDEDMRALIAPELVRAHRRRALTPDRPVMRGTAQNPDVFFQSRERANTSYAATPTIVQETFDKLAALTGRQYRLFDYFGAPDAERVLVMMGSGCEAAEETVAALCSRGEKVGLIKVRLYRPFSAADLLTAFPATTQAIAVLDRTKEPGGAGEPLYQDVLTAIGESVIACTSPFAQIPRVIGGRYGLASKEFTPAMCKSVFDELRKPTPKNHFSVGINDDVTFTSLDYDEGFSTERAGEVRALFWGLGADGTVGASERPPAVSPAAPEFVRHVTGEILAGRGDRLPVSAFPADGTYPVATAQWEKRNIALDVPVWEPDLCIECGKCVLVCPHATIRAKVCTEEQLTDAPAGFKHMPAKWRELPGNRYTIQVAVEDCTGCKLCVEVCPAKDKSRVGRKALNMAPQLPARDEARANWAYFLRLPDLHKNGLLKFDSVKNVQLLQPLFEFSGACAGCGETPYIKLLTQLFGDRALIANATGCSSIYGGNLPTTPYTINAEGRGPAWSNSLFEDNAEFGLGMRMAVDQQNAYARTLVERLRPEIGAALVDSLLTNDQSTESGVNTQRELVAALKARLNGSFEPEVRDLLSVADALVKKSVWIVGGDGWAYDIGYGGLDHVLASGQNVNVLVLDTEVYSNTGGQASKATPLGAVAKFAAGGKATGKKDLGLQATTYGNVYVAQVALGANDTHTVKAFLEAEAHQGPSLIIAYSQCIAHGIDMAQGMNQQKLAVESGYWPLYRYNPARAGAGQNPFQLDSAAPKVPLQDYIYNEARYRMLVQSDPDTAKLLLARAQAAVNERFQHYKRLAEKRDEG